jgi:hypothetical protein
MVLVVVYVFNIHILNNRIELIPKIIYYYLIVIVLVFLLLPPSVYSKFLNPLFTPISMFICAVVGLYDVYISGNNNFKKSLNGLLMGLSIIYVINALIDTRMFALNEYNPSFSLLNIYRKLYLILQLVYNLTIGFLLFYVSVYLRDATYASKLNKLIGYCFIFYIGFISYIVYCFLYHGLYNNDIGELSSRLYKFTWLFSAAVILYRMHLVADSKTLIDISNFSKIMIISAFIFTILGLFMRDIIHALLKIDYAKIDFISICISSILIPTFVTLISRYLPSKTVN